MSSSAQLMRQADNVKATLRDPSKALSEQWGQRQRLEDLYKELLLHDLEYALDKKVEQELWNHAFKNQISALQTQAKDRMSLKKTEARANLDLFLEMASGFYLQFLQMICSTFKLDLPFRRRSSAFGITNENKIYETSIVLPKKSSCLYICCHCLVHLGDIARYLQQTEQAQNYYRHAANLSPNNGQPYNQLAILEASRGDKLSTVFYYIRSLAVRHPFPVAATNLEKLYSKLIKDARDFDSPNLSVAEIIVAFLHFQALLHMSSNFDRVSGLRTKIVSSLASHIRSQTLTAAHLTGIVAISMFALHRARHDTNDSGEPVRKVMLSKEEDQCVHLHISFFAKLLETLVQNTPKEDVKVKDFLTLPTIKVSFDWLSLNRDVLKGREFSNTNLWQDMCKLLNHLQWLLNDSSKVGDPVKYAETPLPEDMDLRCFQPLDAAYGQLNFAWAEKEESSPALERDLRCHRLIAHGKWIAQDLVPLKLMVHQSDKSIRNQFSSQKSASPNEGLQATPVKSNRPNIAMQTILKKQMERKAEEEKNATIEGKDGKTMKTGIGTCPSTGTATTTSTVPRQEGGRQGGVIPVQHHKGGTFKPNLPPRLSGKNKSQPSVSPRLQKKDNDNTGNSYFTSSAASPSTPAAKNARNNNNSKVNTISTAAAAASRVTSTGQSTQGPPGLDSELEYPKLTLDNYPALVGQKNAGVAGSLIMPSMSSSLSSITGPIRPTQSGPGGVNVDVAAGKSQSGWGGFAMMGKMEAESTSGNDRGGVSPSSALNAGGVGGLMSMGDTSFSGLYPPQHSHQPPSTSPRLHSPQAIMEGRHKVTDDSISKMGVQSSISSVSQGFPPFPIEGLIAPGMSQTSATTRLSPASGNPQSQMNALLQQQQQQQLLQNQQRLKLDNLLKQQQHQQQQQHRQQPRPQQQQVFPKYSPSQPPQPTPGTFDYFSLQPSIDQKQQHLPSQIYGNPTTANLLATMQSNMQDPNSVQRGGIYPNTGGIAGLPFSSSSSQALLNQKQQQQQQQHMRGMDGQGDKNAPSGLLYKNIPLPGSGRSHMTSNNNDGGNNSSPMANSALAGMVMDMANKGSSSSANQIQMLGGQPANQIQIQRGHPGSGGSMGGQPTNPMQGHRGHPGNNGGMGGQPTNHMQGQSTNQMQTSQALAQLLALNRGTPSQAGLTKMDLYQPTRSYQTPSKPDLMGLQPPPSFLERHQHDRGGYKSSGQHHHHHPQSGLSHQQPSFMNTVMDPSFLQATGEYSLFSNNNNSNNSIVSSSSSAGGGGNNSSTSNKNVTGGSNPSWAPGTAVTTPMYGSTGTGTKGTMPAPGHNPTTQADVNQSLQALWQSTGPSPLERLLEQQRLQRHNDG